MSAADVEVAGQSLQAREAAARAGRRRFGPTIRSGAIVRYEMRVVG
jgi:hypothetical protein